MGFYNSGIKRMLEGKVSGNERNLRAIRQLRDNEKSDDTSRSSIQGIVNGHTTQINSLTTAYPTAEGIKTATFSINYNDAFYDNGTEHAVDTTVAVPNDREIIPISISVYIYDTGGTNYDPTYRTGNTPHTLYFTRQKDLAMASAANAGNMQDGSAHVKIGYVDSVLQGNTFVGPHIEQSAYVPSASKRSGDHLNMMGSGSAIDDNIWAIFTQGNPAEDTTTEGERTKMKVVFKYRLVARPTLD